MENNRLVKKICDIIVQGTKKCKPKERRTEAVNRLFRARTEAANVLFRIRGISNEDVREMLWCHVQWSCFIERRLRCV